MALINWVRHQIIRIYVSEGEREKELDDEEAEIHLENVSEEIKTAENGNRYWWLKILLNY